MAVIVTVKLDATDLSKAPGLLAPVSSALDGLQSKLKQSESASTAATSKMISGLQGLAQQATRQTVEQSNLSKAFLQTGQAAQTQLNQFQRLQQRYGAASTAASNAAASTNTFGMSLKNLAAGFGLVAGVQTVVRIVTAVGRSFLDNALAMDTVRLSLAGVTGSTAAAGKELQNLQAIAEKTGLGVALLSQQWTGLYAAVSQTPGRLDLARESFSALVETGARLGKSTEQIGAALYGLQQLAGGATVQLDELQKQMGDALPGLFPALAKEMGYTVQEFRNLISQGKILVDDVLAKMPTAIKSLTSGEGSINTATSAFGRMGTAWTNLMDELSKSGTLAIVTHGVGILTDALNRLSGAIRVARQTVTGVTELTGAEQVSGALKNINQQIQETERNIKDLEGREQTTARKQGGAMGLLNRLFTTDPGPELEALRKKLGDLTVAQDALGESAKSLQQTEGKTAPALSASEKAYAARIASLKDLDKTSAATNESIAKLNLELSAVRSKNVEELRAVGLDPLTKEFPQQQKAAEARILEARQKLQDQLLGIDRKGAASAAQSSAQATANRAKADEEQLQASLKRQEALIEQSFDERRRLIDQQASEAITLEPMRVEEIKTDRSKALRAAAVEEAQALEKVRLDSLDRQLAAALRTADLEIAAHKGKPAEIAKFEAEKVTAVEKSNAEREAIVKRTGEVELQTGAKTLAEQIKNAEELVKVTADSEQKRLEARIDTSDDQIALIEAQVDGEVLTIEEGYQQIRAIMDRRLEDTRQLYILQAEEAINGIAAEVRETALGQAQILEIKTGLNDKLRGLDLQRATEEQEFLNKQVQAYERFVDKVSSGLASIFEGLIDGTLDLLDSFKRLFLRTLSQLIAEAATRTIIVPIITSVLGGVASLAPGIAGTAAQAIGLAGAATGAGTGSSGIGTLEGVGLLASLKTVGGSFMTGLEGLTDAIVGAGSQISTAFGGPAIYGPGFVGPIPEGGMQIGGASGALAGNIAGVAGGLAALGGGIYAALNASNAASQAAFAASAAAGAAAAATAAYGAVTGAAVVTAGGTGWTGIGLIVAAVMAVIGVVLDRVIKPSGPTLAVGRPSGLGVGVEGGQLAVAGDLGSRVLRQEKIDPGLATSVQAQMEDGITSAVMGVVQTINAVALDPTKLLEPTQAALRDALASVKDLNSSNAEKMQSDITDQLRFINIQIVAGMLDPVNKAFEQLLFDATLEEQLERLPGTTSGLVAIFKNLNVQLEEIAKSENTDVLRQLSAVRGQVEDFGNRIAGTAGQIAEEIVTGIIESFETEIDPTLAGQITQFAELMNDSFGALAGLRATQQTLEGAGLPGGGVGAQIDRLTNAMGLAAERMATEIVSTALSGISADLQQVLVQPLTVQATTVNALFNDALAALSAIGQQWSVFSAGGLDTAKIQDQFTRLLGGILDTTTQVLDQALTEGSFSEFLDVLGSIPDAVTDLNPAFAELKALGAIFATVVDPIVESLVTFEEDMRTTADSIALTDTRITDLEAAIGDAGDSADRALPLYAELGEEIVSNADLQIEAIEEIQQAQERALNQVQSDIDTLAASMGVFDDQIARVFDALGQSVSDFNTAIAATDTLGAIEAVEAYGAGLVDLADLQIEQIEAQHQASIDAQQDVIDATQEQIDAVNDAISAQQDLVDSLQDEVTARQEAVDAIESQIESLTRLSDQIGELTRAELAPAKAAPAIRAEIAATGAHLVTATGDAAIDDLDKLVSLNEELLQLGEDSDQLILVKEAMDNLALLQTDLDARLAGEERQLSVAEQQLAVDEAALDAANAQLDTLNAELDVLNAQLEVEQKVLEAIQESTAWEEHIAAIQTQLMTDLQAIEQWLISVEGDTSWEDQILKIQKDTVAWLQQIERDLQALFLKTVESTGAAGISTNVQVQQLARLQTISEYNLKLPIPMTVSNFYEAPHQRGGPVMLAAGGVAPQLASVNRDMTGPMTVHHYASGGRVPVKLEPGEAVFIPPFTSKERQALQVLNTAVPRFAAETPAYRFGGIVPGSGSGDTVKATLPRGAFVLNREAVKILDQPKAAMAARVPPNILRVVQQIMPTQRPEMSTRARRDDQPLHFPPRQLPGSQASDLVPLSRHGSHAMNTAVAHEASKVMPRAIVPMMDNADRTAMHMGVPRFARGGQVSVTLEPQEGVFSPPQSRAQVKALLALNAAFPRTEPEMRRSVDPDRVHIFGGRVPDSGTGDTVPTTVAAGTIIVNRRAMTALDDVLPKIVAGETPSRLTRMQQHALMAMPKAFPGEPLTQVMRLPAPKKGDDSPREAQRDGGLIGREMMHHFATGGVVKALLAPGDGVFVPPFSRREVQALEVLNRLKPRAGETVKGPPEPPPMQRFGGVVPGQGTGDHVAALIPRGALILNQEAMQAIQESDSPGPQEAIVRSATVAVEPMAGPPQATRDVLTATNTLQVIRPIIPPSMPSPERTRADVPLRFPVEAKSTESKQHGGLITPRTEHIMVRQMAVGGSVPVKLEPREGVFTPPFKPGEQQALLQVNALFPRSAPAIPFERASKTAHRFGGLVPGAGSGDTVSTQVPAETIILNRHAMAALVGVSQGQEIPIRATTRQRDALEHVHEVFRQETFRQVVDVSKSMPAQHAAMGLSVPSISSFPLQGGGLVEPRPMMMGGPSSVPSWPGTPMRDGSQSAMFTMPPSRAPGYQGGGPVQGNGSKSEVHHHDNRVIFQMPNLTIRSHQDLEELKRALTELARRTLKR